LWKEEKEDEPLFKNYTDEKINLPHLKFFSGEEEEKRNDVYIYKTLRYPPKSTPPTTD